MFLGHRKTMAWDPLYQIPKFGQEDKRHVVGTEQNSGGGWDR